MKQILSA